MSDTIYTIINWVSALMIIELGIVLALFKTKSGHDYIKYNTARKWLSVACVTLGVLTAVNQLVPSDTDYVMWLRVVALCIAALQAMLFTMTILSIIAVRKVTCRYIACQTLFIVLGGMGLMTVSKVWPGAAQALFCLGIIAYLTLLVYYAHVFIRNYRLFRQEIFSYYESAMDTPTLLVSLRHRAAFFPLTNRYSPARRAFHHYLYLILYILHHPVYQLPPTTADRTAGYRQRRICHIH